MSHESGSTDRGVRDASPKRSGALVHLRPSDLSCRPHAIIGAGSPFVGVRLKSVRKEAASVRGVASAEMRAEHVEAAPQEMCDHEGVTMSRGERLRTGGRWKEDWKEAGLVAGRCIIDATAESTA